MAKGKKNAWVVPDANRGKGVKWEFTYDKPADNWFEIAFDDSKWRRGRSGFGSPGTPGSKVRTPWHSSDIWLRRDFRFDTIPGLSGDVPGVRFMAPRLPDRVSSLETPGCSASWSKTAPSDLILSVRNIHTVRSR